MKNDKVPLILLSFALVAPDVYDLKAAANICFYFLYSSCLRTLVYLPCSNKDNRLKHHYRPAVMLIKV